MSTLPDPMDPDSIALDPAALEPAALDGDGLPFAVAVPAAPGWWSRSGGWEPAWAADPAQAAFRASYADPARVQTLAAGPLFDVLSVEMMVGLETAQLLITDRQPLGPVAVDSRIQVRRVGFLLPPDTFRRARGFAWWCRNHAMRTVSHGDVVALPPLIGTASARFQWLVAPGVRGVAGTDPAALLVSLRQVLRAGRIRQAADHFEC
jgi:hypothetical protein